MVFFMSPPIIQATLNQSSVRQRRVVNVNQCRNDAPVRRDCIADRAAKQTPRRVVRRITLVRIEFLQYGWIGDLQQHAVHRAGAVIENTSRIRPKIVKASTHCRRANQPQCIYHVRNHRRSKTRQERAVDEHVRRRCAGHSEALASPLGPRKRSRNTALVFATSHAALAPRLSCSRPMAISSRSSQMSSSLSVSCCPEGSIPIVDRLHRKTLAVYHNPYATAASSHRHLNTVSLGHVRICTNPRPRPPPPPPRRPARMGRLPRQARIRPPPAHLHRHPQPRRAYAKPPPPRPPPRLETLPQWPRSRQAPAR